MDEKSGPETLCCGAPTAVGGYGWKPFCSTHARIAYTGPEALGLLRSHDAIEMARAFGSVTDPATRKALITIVKRAAGIEQAAEAA